jgi:hypothetical protein
MSAGAEHLSRKHLLQEDPLQEDSRKGDEGCQEKYTREHFMTILSRVRRSGGIPMEEKTRKHVASWLRGLALRGFVDGKLLSDGPATKDAFRTFDNPTTRGQYARAIVAYIGGLTDDEFSLEYPDVTRGAVVKLMKDIATEAGRENKARRPAEV